MNYIDAVEGSVCMIFQRMHQSYLNGTRDDSEFIGNVKMVIDGVQDFIQAHPELMIAHDVVWKVLYNHAKQLWLKSSADEKESTDSEKPANEDDPESTAYRNYYFDYIYQHGAYPR